MSRASLRDARCNNIVTLAVVLTMTIVIILGQAAVVHAYPDGAGACMRNADDVDSYQYHHGGPTDRNDVIDGVQSLVVSIGGVGEADADSATPPHLVSGCDYLVTVCARRPFKGLLLYSSIADDVSTRIGAFTIPSSHAAHFQYFVECGDGGGDRERSTLTHVHAEQYDATRIDFVWTAPTSTAMMSTGKTDVNFRVTGVFTSKEDWLTASTGPLRVAESSQPSMCPPVTRAVGCPVVETADVVPMASLPADTAVAHSGDHDAHAGHAAAAGAAADPHAGHGTGAGGHSVQFNTAWRDMKLIWESWTLDNKSTYMATLAGVLLMAVLYEALQTLHFELTLKFRRDGLKRSAAQTMLWSTPLAEWQYMVLTALHTGRVFLGMLLMMVFMTLEKGLVAAMMSGYGVGFYLFYRRRFRFTVKDRVTSTNAAGVKDVERAGLVSSSVELEERVEAGGGCCCE